jgi:hypothetical protein
MPRFKGLITTGLVVFVGVAAAVLALDALPDVLAAPPSQFPTNSVAIVSDPPPPDLPGQFSEATLIQADFWDPHPEWRLPVFDDGSWQPSYPVVTQTTWGPPVGGTFPPADFIWGGVPGTPAGNRYNIPISPAPQYLFLRKSFCIPINADLSSVAALNPLRLEVATTNNPPGFPSASVYYNGAPIGLNLPGDESGFVYSLNLDPTTVAAVRRLGRNTLAMRVRDAVDDTRAGVAYGLQFNYAIDPSAITLSSNPPGSSAAGTPVTFSQTNNGLSGDSPFTFEWDFGDGTTSTTSAPSKTYNTPGTYVVTLAMTDRFGCPSAPVSLQYEVLAPIPPDEDEEDEDEQDVAPPAPTPLPTPSPTPTPIPTPTPSGPLYLPETGSLAQPPPTGSTLPIVGGILFLVTTYLLIHHRPGPRR